MQNRVIEISGVGAALSIRDGLLRVTPKAAAPSDIPLGSIGSVLLSEPAVSLTGAVVAELAARNVAIVHCGRDYRPAAVTLPVSDSHAVCLTMESQFGMALPLRKRLWQRIVQAKIRNQAAVLDHATGQGAPLNRIADEVRSGDPDNVEARAAALFWRGLSLFDRRDRAADDANRLFNYAYTVLYSGVTRALCAVSLSPHIGLHHRSGRNPFCLASDVMEPYRFLGELAALDARDRMGTEELTVPVKKALIEAIHATPFRLGGCTHTFAQAVFLTAASLKAAVLSGEDRLTLPDCIGMKGERHVAACAV
jgi:CRISPR-associated protein Cas1